MFHVSCAGDVCRMTPWTSCCSMACRKPDTSRKDGTSSTRAVVMLCVCCAGCVLVDRVVIFVFKLWLVWHIVLRHKLLSRDLNLFCASLVIFVSPLSRRVSVCFLLLADFALPCVCVQVLPLLRDERRRRRQVHRDPDLGRPGHVHPKRRTVRPFAAFLPCVSFDCLSSFWLWFVCVVRCGCLCNAFLGRLSSFCNSMFWPFVCAFCGVDLCCVLVFFCFLGRTVMLHCRRAYPWFSQWSSRD